MARIGRSAWLVVLVGALPAYAAVVRCIDTLRDPGGDACAVIEQRYAPLRRVLGATRRVGYRGDVDSSELRSTALSAARYACAQYALAPIEVVLSDAEVLVVAQLTAEPALQLERLAPYRILYTFGGGLFLLEPKQP